VQIGCGVAQIRCSVAQRGCGVAHADSVRRISDGSAPGTPLEIPLLNVSVEDTGVGHEG
jgi:hypothetical protein